MKEKKFDDFREIRSHIKMTLDTYLHQKWTVGNRNIVPFAIGNISIRNQFNGIRSFANQKS